MCYKHSSEEKFTHGAAAEFYWISRRAEAAGFCSGNCAGDGIRVSLLPELLGPAGVAELQADLSRLRVLYVLLRFSLGEALAYQARRNRLREIISR